MTTDQPLVSVIMFCRNRVSSIRRAVESILKQTYSNWELIIQDGASTDGTREAIESYRDPRIKLVSETDSGPFDAMWRAYRRAGGEVFASCLSDEELLPDAINEGVNYLLFNPAAAAILRDVDYTDIEGGTLQRVNGDEFNFMDYLAMQFSLALCTMQFRRTALEAIGLRDRKWRTDCADFELLVRLGERYPIDYYPGVAARYAQFHEGQLSTDPHLSFQGVCGQMRFINDFFLESSPQKPFRHLRPFPLIVAYKKFRALYQKKGELEYGQKLEQLFATFDCRYGVSPLELAKQAIGIGSLDLASDILADLSPSSVDFHEALHLRLEILRSMGKMEKLRELIVGFGATDNGGLPTVTEMGLSEGKAVRSGVNTDSGNFQIVRRLDDKITLACWAGAERLSETVLECWANILKHLPYARLLLVNAGLRASDYRRYLRTCFSDHGLPRENLLLIGSTTPFPLPSVVRQSDLYLEPFSDIDSSICSVELKYAIERMIPAVKIGLPSSGENSSLTIVPDIKSYIVTSVKWISRKRKEPIKSGDVTAVG